MTTKHAPATPLPWRIAEYETTSRPDRFGRTTHTRSVSIMGTNGYNSIAKFYVGHASGDPTYTAHSANAYPQLVEALRSMLATHHVEVAPTEADKESIQLLRDLGEL